MDETWVSRDLPVLNATVELLEQQDLVQPAKVTEQTGLAEREVTRAWRALDGRFIQFHSDFSGGYVDDVTPEARQAVGQWPSGEALIRGLVEGLAAAAEKETDPERRSGLRQAAVLLGGAARDIAVGLAQRYAELRLGMGA